MTLWNWHWNNDKNDKCFTIKVTILILSNLCNLSFIMFHAKELISSIQCLGLICLFSMRLCLCLLKWMNTWAFRPEKKIINRQFSGNLNTRLVCCVFWLANRCFAQNLLVKIIFFEIWTIFFIYFNHKQKNKVDTQALVDSWGKCDFLLWWKNLFKCWKRWIQPAKGVQSTYSLV